MNEKPIFNLHLAYEDAKENADKFRAEHQDLYMWDDPRDFYGQKMTIRTDEFYPTKTFDANLAEMYEVGTVEDDAKKALLWLMHQHTGFNALEMNQIIVGKKNPGFGEDTMVAIFAYLSKENDLLRDFITEKALDL